MSNYVNIESLFHYFYFFLSNFIKLNIEFYVSFNGLIRIPNRLEMLNGLKMQTISDVARIFLSFDDNI